VIREVGEAVGESVVDSVGRLVGRTQERRPLDSDLLESEAAYLVVFDAPGVRAEDVQVRYEDGAVHVRLDRYRDTEGAFEMRFPGRGLTLSGRRSLPAEAVVEPDGATANLRPNGTLEVLVPRADDVPDQTG
jgi:HSP20 family molecular chaperone IbpA